MKTSRHDNTSAAQHLAAASHASGHGDLAAQSEEVGTRGPFAHAAHSAWDHRVNGSPRQVAQQRTLGTAFGSTARPVQRQIATVSLNDEDLIEVTRDDHRPQGNLRGHTGDHTTPYVSFDHQIMAAVEGQDLPTAWNSLLRTFAVIQTMPGYQDSQYRGQFDQLGNLMAGTAVNTVTVDTILLIGNRIIEVRNMLKYSAYPAKPYSTGGNNEAVLKGLLLEERHIRKDGDPNYTRDQIMFTMWATFDHQRLEMSVSTDGERTSVLLQHRISMVDTYWRVAEAYGISADSLNAYYKAHYL